MTVWKFNLEIVGRSTVTMPRGARILYVDDQDPGDRYLQLWAEVDPHALSENRHFAVVGTGHPLPEERYHLGSVLQFNGKLVWHVYEVSA